MIEAQMLTGIRSGELVTMRPCDIDVTGKPWPSHPAVHKTEHRGYQRLIPISPRGQKRLKPFLARKVDDYPKDGHLPRDAQIKLVSNRRVVPP